jgi:hypothetical protein
LNAKLQEDIVFHSAKKVYFSYVPEDFVDDTYEYTRALLDFLESELINDKIDRLEIHMYKGLLDVR